MCEPDIDRRSKSRICAPFSVAVRGVDANGERFKFETVVDNVSSTGLYLYSPRPLVTGSRLFLIVRFSTPDTDEALAPRFAMLGIVRRAELKTDGMYGAAIAFTNQRPL